MADVEGADCGGDCDDGDNCDGPRPAMHVEDCDDGDGWIVVLDETGVPIGDAAGEMAAEARRRLDALADSIKHNEHTAERGEEGK